MIDLPDSVANHLLASEIALRSPAYLLLAKDGEVLRSGGDLGLYGLVPNESTDDADSLVGFLGGMLPLAAESSCLRMVELDSGAIADVHLVPSAQGDWVVFLDARKHAAEIQALHQRKNETQVELDKLKSTSLRETPLKSLPTERDAHLRKLLASMRETVELLSRALEERDRE